MCVYAVRVLHEGNSRREARHKGEKQQAVQMDGGGAQAGLEAEEEVGKRSLGADANAGRLAPAEQTKPRPAPAIAGRAWARAIRRAKACGQHGKLRGNAVRWSTRMRWPPPPLCSASLSATLLLWVVCVVCAGRTGGLVWRRGGTHLFSVPCPCLWGWWWWWCGSRLCVPLVTLLPQAAKEDKS